MSADKTKEKLQDFEDEAEARAQTLTERALEWRRTATNGISNFAQTTDTYVRKNPWPAIGMTALFAFALGIIASGRRR